MSPLQIVIGFWILGGITGAAFIWFAIYLHNQPHVPFPPPFRPLKAPSFNKSARKKKCAK